MRSATKQKLGTETHQLKDGTFLWYEDGKLKGWFDYKQNIWQDWLGPGQGDEGWGLPRPYRGGELIVPPKDAEERKA